MIRIHSSYPLAVALSAIAILVGACSSTSSTTTTTHYGINGPDNGVKDLEIAPLFSVETADGGTFSLDDHLVTDGRPVFLNLWASWCFPCRSEMPAIDAAAKVHPEVAFVGVSVKDPSRADADDFLEEVGVTYTIGFDPDNDVDNKYRPLGLPASYIISSDGVILERIFGEVTEDSLAEKFEKYFG
jgi:thiol-disulfide isomerase/thioredoxin